MGLVRSLDAYASRRDLPLLATDYDVSGCWAWLLRAVRFSLTAELDKRKEASSICEREVIGLIQRWGKRGNLLLAAI